jgi:hypothetical protein
MLKRQLRHFAVPESSLVMMTFLASARILKGSGKPDSATAVGPLSTEPALDKDCWTGALNCFSFVFFGEFIGCFSISSDEGRAGGGETGLAGFAAFWLILN